MAKLILATDKPREHKRLGRRVKKFDGKAWNEKCEDIVKCGNLAKVNLVLGLLGHSKKITIWFPRGLT